jgi:hypothetical protein
MVNSTGGRCCNQYDPALTYTSFHHNCKPIVAFILARAHLYWICTIKSLHFTILAMKIRNRIRRKIEFGRPEPLPLIDNAAT